MLSILVLYRRKHIVIFTAQLSNYSAVGADESSNLK